MQLLEELERLPLLLLPEGMVTAVMTAKNIMASGHLASEEDCIAVEKMLKNVGNGISRGPRGRGRGRA